jgi:hypothetical protein
MMIGILGVLSKSIVKLKLVLGDVEPAWRVERGQGWSHTGAGVDLAIHKWAELE